MLFLIYCDPMLFFTSSNNTHDLTIFGSINCHVSSSIEAAFSRVLCIKSRLLCTASNSSTILAFSCSLRIIHILMQWNVVSPAVYKFVIVCTFLYLTSESFSASNKHFCFYFCDELFRNSCPVP